MTPQVGGAWTHKGEWCSIFHQVESRTFIGYELHTRLSWKQSAVWFLFCFFVGLFFWGVKGYFVFNFAEHVLWHTYDPGDLLNMYLIVTSASFLDSDRADYVLYQWRTGYHDNERNVSLMLVFGNWLHFQNEWHLHLFVILAIFDSSTDPQICLKKKKAMRIFWRYNIILTIWAFNVQHFEQQSIFLVEHQGDICCYRFCRFTQLKPSDWKDSAQTCCHSIKIENKLLKMLCMTQLQGGEAGTLRGVCLIKRVLIIAQTSNGWLEKCFMFVSRAVQ